jgi:hypothetical protein
MRIIKTHKARNIFEIADILLKSKIYVCCNLPHYRYMPTKRACVELLKSGAAVLAHKGKIDFSIKPTRLLEEWANTDRFVRPSKFCKELSKGRELLG